MRNITNNKMTSKTSRWTDKSLLTAINGRKITRDRSLNVRRKTGNAKRESNRVQHQIDGELQHLKGQKEGKGVQYHMEAEKEQNLESHKEKDRVVQIREGNRENEA
jgi:hypothetical protein